MSLVEFTSDVYPYCKGDIVKLEGKEQKLVDELAEARGVKAYVKVASAADAAKAKAKEEADARAKAEADADAKAKPDADAAKANNTTTK